MILCRLSELINGFTSLVVPNLRVPFVAAFLYSVTFYLLNDCLGPSKAGKVSGICELVKLHIKLVHRWLESTLELGLEHAWGQDFPGLSHKSCKAPPVPLLSLMLAWGRDSGSILSDFLSYLVAGCRQKGWASFNKAIYSSLPAFRWPSRNKVAVSSKV